MRVLVSGSRDYKNREFMYDVLDGIHSKTPITCVIHGAARGADTLAEEWALRGRDTIGSSLSIERYPADWIKYAKAAGAIRNQQMLDVGFPDLVVAFPLLHSKGTWDMIERSCE